MAKTVKYYNLKILVKKLINQPTLGTFLNGTDGPELISDGGKGGSSLLGPLFKRSLNEKYN